jgi:G3E family GTPase
MVLRDCPSTHLGESHSHPSREIQTLLNGVQHVVHPPVHLDAWPDDDRRSRLVFIGRDLDPESVERSLLAFNAASH